MKKKLFVLIMTLAMVSCFMPAFAFAEEATDEAAEVTENAELTQEEPAEETEGTAELMKNYDLFVTPEGAAGVVDDGNGTITLSNFTGERLKIDTSVDIKIVLEGENTIEGNNLYIYGNGEINPKVEICGSGSLTINYEDGNAIWANYTDLIISGGTVNSTSGRGDGILSLYGDITISGGKVSVQAPESNSAGIRPFFGDLNITGGTVEAFGGYYGLATVGGNVNISGGNIVAQGSADGITVDKVLTVSGGSVKAIGENGGIEAYESIKFTGGTTEASGNKYYGVASFSEAEKNTITLENVEEVHGYSTIVEPLADPEAVADPCTVVDFVTVFVTEDGKTSAKDVKIAPVKEFTSSADSFRATASGKKAIQLAWPVTGDADKFVVYGNKCGKKNAMLKLAEVTDATNYLVTAINGKGLKKNTAYKFYLEAYKDGQLVASSYEAHAYTTGYRGKYGNVTKITSKTKSVKVKVGKTAKKALKIKTKRVKGKKLMPKSHGPQLRYVSSNPAVATVTKKGKVKGVSVGTATIYTYSINGFFCTTAVTVS